MEGMAYRRKFSTPYVEIGSYFFNFCIMRTEKRHTSVRAGDRGRVSSHERTCVRGAEGSALKRTFQVVAEMQLCAAERGRDNGNRDHAIFYRYDIDWEQWRHFIYRI